MSRCVSCGDQLFSDIVYIGNQYPSAVFISEDTPKIESSSLNVTKCKNKRCELVQLSNRRNLDSIFEHYPYDSSSTASMKGILFDIVKDISNTVSLNSEDVVLDIGGNDGTLLDLINTPIKAKVNIDAAADVNQVCKDPNYIHIHSKFNSSVYRNTGLPNPRLIFSVAMFYHLSDPLQFCYNVKEIMNDDTVWVLQMTHLGSMLKDKIVDNIVHEHVAYYSLRSLQFLLSQAELYVVDAQIVESYGGSLRVFIVKDRDKYPKDKLRKRYWDVVKFETDHKTNSDENLYVFNENIKALQSTLKSLMDHLTEVNGPIWGFGASTKGNMLLQFLGFSTDHISHILDNNPKKIGKRTSGSMIPIIDENTNLKNSPKYLMVLPYYYKKTFIPIIKKQIPKGHVVYLFVPLPYPHFISIMGDYEK